MAACTTTYYEAGRSMSARVAERNAELMAQQAQRRRGVRTPEFAFPRHIDNSRLVKAPDPVRARQMRGFTIAAAVLLLLTMIYGVQHFSAIESGYRIEAEKQVRDQLLEQNRQLRLNEAELTQPDRIDRMARAMGMNAPEPDQMMRFNDVPDASAPALAMVAAPVLGGQAGAGN